MDYIHSRTITECPLGIYDCELQHLDINQPWKSCHNASYCKGVTQAWDLPLVPMTIGFRVRLHRLCPRFGFSTEKVYKNYMKRHGWAEAVQLPYKHYTYRLQEVPSLLEVHENMITAGFAEAVPLFNPKHFPNMHRCEGYAQDCQGLWWYGDRRKLKPVLR